MTWIRSRAAWMAGLLALFGLLRALRRMADADQGQLALGVAVAVVVAAALLPVSLRPADTDQVGARKAAQFLAAGMVTALAVLLGAGLLVAGGLGVLAALLVALVWPTRTAAAGSGRADRTA